MEKLRADRWNECVVLLQKNMRRFIQRLRYLRMKEITIKLQQVARMKMGKRKLELIKYDRAAVVIQKHCRTFLARRLMERRRSFVTHLQAAIRGHLARRAFGSFRVDNAATTIQKLVRGWMVRKKFNAQRNHIVRIQACVRRRLARKALGELRVEARSATHLKEVSYKLENTVVDLTQNLTKAKEEREALRQTATQLESQIKMWEERYEKLERKSRQASSSLEEQHRSTSQELETLRQTHTALQSEHEQVVARMSSQTEELEQLRLEVTELRNNSVAHSNAAARKDNEDVSELKNQIAALKAQLSQSLKNPPPRRQASLNAYSRNLSPIRTTNMNRRGVSPERMSPHGRSPTGSNMAQYRRNSITERSPVDAVSTSKVMYTEPEQMRPMSIDHVETMRDIGNPEEAVRKEKHEGSKASERIHAYMKLCRCILCCRRRNYWRRRLWKASSSRSRSSRPTRRTRHPIRRSSSLHTRLV